jgi:hypothetical protein
MTPIDGSDHPMILVAQQILDSLIDVRPEYANKRVIGVRVENEPSTVSVLLDNESHVRFTGLFAATILRAS